MGDYDGIKRWDYDGIMMGLWWDYDGIMVGLWWDYDGIMMGLLMIAHGFKL